jgi:hypothetical protein
MTGGLITALDTTADAALSLNQPVKGLPYAGRTAEIGVSYALDFNGVPKGRNFEPPSANS